MILAVIEWNTFGPDGVLDDDGYFLYIGEMYIHDSLDGVKTIKQFIRTILDKAPQAEVGFFVREYKYQGRLPRQYKRKQFERLVR